MAVYRVMNTFDLRQDKTEFNLNSSPLAFWAKATHWSVHLKSGVMIIYGFFTALTAFTVNSP